MKTTILLLATVFASITFSTPLSAKTIQFDNASEEKIAPGPTVTVCFSVTFGTKNQCKGFGFKCFSVNGINPFGNSTDRLARPTENCCTAQMIDGKTLQLRILNNLRKTERTFEVTEEDVLVFSRYSKELGYSYIELIPGQYPITQNRDGVLVVNLGAKAK